MSENGLSTPQVIFGVLSVIGPLTLGIITYFLKERLDDVKNHKSSLASILSALTVLENKVKSMEEAKKSSDDKLFTLSTQQTQLALTFTNKVDEKFTSLSVDLVQIKMEWVKETTFNRELIKTDNAIKSIANKVDNLLVLNSGQSPRKKSSKNDED